MGGRFITAQPWAADRRADNGEVNAGLARLSKDLVLDGVQRILPVAGTAGQAITASALSQHQSATHRQATLESVSGNRRLENASQGFGLLEYPDETGFRLPHGSGRSEELTHGPRNSYRQF